MCDKCKVATMKRDMQMRHSIYCSREPHAQATHNKKHTVKITKGTATIGFGTCPVTEPCPYN